MTPDHLKNQNQALTLGLGRDGAAAVDKALSGIPQRDTLLEDPCIEATQLGLVTDILVAGTSLMASDKGCDILMFHPECYIEGHRALGIPVAKTQSVVVKATLDANGVMVGHVGGQPLPRVEGAPPPDPTESGDLLAYAFGLGSVVVGAGARGILSAKATRNTTLGAMFLDMGNVAGARTDMMMEYAKINNRPMLIGRQDTVIDTVPVAAFGYLSTDVDGRVLAQDVEVGDTVSIGLLNNNAAAITVYGGIFCMNGDEE